MFKIFRRKKNRVNISTLSETEMLELFRKEINAVIDESKPKEEKRKDRGRKNRRTKIHY